MRLREKQKPGDRKPLARDVLSDKPAAEATLNEQIRLPAGLKERWEDLLKIETGDEVDCAHQVQLMGDLITLFPAEAGRIRQLAPLGKLIEMLKHGQEWNPGMVDAWSRVKLLAPELVPPMPDRVFQQQLEQMREAGTSAIFYFDAMRIAATLFPERIEELKRRIVVDKRDPDLDEEFGGELFRIMKYLMMVDPSLHPTFHAYTNSRRVRLEKIAKGWRTNWAQLTTNTSGELFSAYKLILAEEIQQLPSGLLLAVEKPRLGRQNALPERLLAV